MGCFHLATRPITDIKTLGICFGQPNIMVCTCLVALQLVHSLQELK